ncbi:MAG: YggS family pyridoxal phosphate-dependent enzyme [Anaerolineae bacterium]|nr:YggS family pyridoxal phosphate-dependent enzyme [Anaerolineae bacterium]
MTIAENIEQVRETIATACARVQRDPAAVQLVAVSKTHPAEAVLEAVAAGVQHFGENRVEEAKEKIPQANEQAGIPLTWHMIGHIQSRKAKDVLALFQMVHSVDSLKLAERLSRLLVEQDQTLDVLLEVNVSGEESKSGFQAADWSQNEAVRQALWQEIEQVLALPGVHPRGLMTMAPIVEDMEQARPVFANLAALRDALAESFEYPFSHLSMGMTDDYPVAIEEGATIIRVGRAIFGERQVR